MKLYYAPGACSLGIHVLLEETGRPYEVEKIDLRAGQQHEPPFKAINPKSKVPTLERDDGSILTEFPAIALWLSRTNPDKGLLPTDPDGEARAVEAMDYVVATIHMQGFGRIFRPGNFSPTEADHDQVKARGREIFLNGLKLVDGRLEGKDYLCGAAMSAADAALFYVEFWATARAAVELPPNCAAHYGRMLSRPAVQRVMAAEGLS